MTASLALLLSVSLAMQAVTTGTGTVGPTPAETESSAEAVASPEERALLQRYNAAQAKVEQYRASGDVEVLRAARLELSAWLVEHQTLYGTQTAAEAIRAPVRDQVAQIDAVLTTTAPLPPPVTVAPAPRPSSAGRRMITAGAVLLPVGVVLGATVAAPLWFLRDGALERAEDRRFHVEEQRDLRRARTAHASGWVAMGFSVAFMSAGVALLTAGIARKAMHRHASVVPVFTPRFAGMSTSVRF